MIRSPNLGINEFSVGVGLRHYLSQESFNAKPSTAPDKPAYPKGLHWNVFAAGGVHSCPVELDAILVSDRPERLAPARFQGTVGAESVWRYSPIFATGIGLEANYVCNNYRQTDLLLTGGEDPDGYSPIRIAAFVKQEFWYRCLSSCCFRRLSFQTLRPDGGRQAHLREDRLALPLQQAWRTVRGPRPACTPV